MSSIQVHLERAVQFFFASPTPMLDAEILLAYVLRKPRSYVRAWPEYILQKHEAEHFAELMHMRADGKPIAYITQHQEFWSLPFMVNETVLIPRPETELLVEMLLQSFVADYPANILELGTGSGAVALSLASERPAWQMVATDVSPAALGVAQHNAKQLQVSSVQFVQSDWFGQLPKQQFDAIVSNPPYVEASSPYLREGDVRYEPMQALVSGEDGLDAIRHIVREAAHYLKPGGCVCMEHGFDQGAAVRAILRQHGYTDIATRRDMQGLERVSYGQFEKRERPEFNFELQPHIKTITSRS